MYPSDLAPTVAAYIAGMIDGEGSVGAFVDKNHPDGRHVAIYIRVYNADAGALQWMQTETGIGAVKVARKGTETHRTSWVWDIGGGFRIAWLLGQTTSYMHIKVPQAQLMLTLCGMRRGNTRYNSNLTEQEIIVGQFNILNARGPRPGDSLMQDLRFA